MRTAALWLALTGTSAAQYGTIEHEQKIPGGGGGQGPILGLEYRFGVSVASIGDFDGDGIPDVAVGAHRADRGGEERGAVYLLFLRADGTVRESREISAVAGGLVGPLDDHDRFGISVCALGDLDRDGTMDLAVGAYRDDDGNQDAGAVHVLFLAPDGSVKAEHKISALSGNVGATLSVEDSFGWSVEALDDLDGDGVIDLAVGATRDDGINADPSKDFGALYLLFLDADGTVKDHLVIDSRGASMGLALKPRDRFGSDVVSLGDADGDGYPELAVGAFGDDPLKYGKVFVLHLGAGGMLRSFQEIGRNTGGFTGLLDTGDRFGTSLAAEDLDGDGLRDLCVGATGDDDGGADAGALWACLLDSLGRVRSQEKISPFFGGFGGTLSAGDSFGVSCTTVGDLDRDGAVDLAVGAYQDDESGYGAGALWMLFRAGIGRPVADFLAVTARGPAPLGVAFGDRSSGAITVRSWDFGDGTSSSATSPLHTYTAAGLYSVALTVTGPGGSDTELRRGLVLVDPPVAPVAAFSVTPSSGAPPFNASFTDLSTGAITTWSWSFGDGTSSALQHPSHVYAATGKYTVSLTVTGDLGTSTRRVVGLISVEPAPVAGFGASPTSGQAPISVQFSDLSTGNAQAWSWSFGDGTSSSERNPLHTYAQGGKFDVSLRVTGPGGSTTLLRPGLIQTTPPLEADFSFTPTGGVAPLSVQFTDLSRNGAASWTWDFGDGTPTSTQRHPSHVFQVGGTFPVTLTVRGNGKVDTHTLPIVVSEPRPVARFMAIPNQGEAPLRVEFTDRSTGVVTSWDWDFGDGTSSNLRDPLHAYQAGTYNVTLRVTGPGGTAGILRKDLIHVTPRPPTKDGPIGPLKPAGAALVPLTLPVVTTIVRALLP